tara:strand:- start:1045 stop:1293 length:249 start_codon:yes stop_codon:yes gene_type:complete
MDIKNYLYPLNPRLTKNQCVRITNKNGGMPLEDLMLLSKIYFVKIELFTPACSHFLIVGLMNDIGRAVKTANEITSIRSVVK